MLQPSVTPRHPRSFGGGFKDRDPWSQPCAEISIRIGLEISATGDYTFDPAWVVEVGVPTLHPHFTLTPIPCPLL
jgi:hypothetical protein